MLSTWRAITVIQPLTNPIILSAGNSGTGWIHLAKPKNLDPTTAITVVQNFRRRVRKNPAIEYAAVYADVNYGPQTLKAHSLAPRAGSVIELHVSFGYYGMPPSLQEAVTYLRDFEINDPQQDGLWAKVEPTPRALGFIARGNVTYI